MCAQMVSRLQDAQVEVRETASAAVAVLVRICGENMAIQLSADFKAWASHPIPKSGGFRGAQGGAAGEDAKNEVDKAELKAALQRRHAGALSLYRVRMRRRML